MELQTRPQRTLLRYGKVYTDRQNASVMYLFMLNIPSPLLIAVTSKVDRDEALCYVLPTPLGTNTFSSTGQQFIRSRLDNCRSLHSLCNIEGEASFMPTRVLDTQKALGLSVRLVMHLKA